MPKSRSQWPRKTTSSPAAGSSVPHSDVPTSFLASTSRPHTRCLGDMGLPPTPALSWPEVAGASPAPPLCPVDKFPPNSSALSLTRRDAADSGGRLLVSSCRKSSGVSDGMGWQVSTRCKTCALNLAQSACESLLVLFDHQAMTLRIGSPLEGSEDVLWPIPRSSSPFYILEGNMLECEFMSRRNRTRANTKV